MNDTIQIILPSNKYNDNKEILRKIELLLEENNINYCDIELS